MSVGSITNRVSEYEDEMNRVFAVAGERCKFPKHQISILPPSRGPENQRSLHKKRINEMECYYYN
jgi:hypothetical protein